MKVCLWWSLAASIILAGCGQSAPQDEAWILLDGEWRFREAGAAHWEMAEVPGVVHTDLIRTGRIPDPYRDSNLDSVQWIEGKDWEYERAFTLQPGSVERDHVELVFKGLDTFAEIRLNDSLIGTTDNMFRTWTFPVKGILIEGANRLHITFRSAITKGSELLAAYGRSLPADNDRGEVKVSPFVRKAGVHFGWDFAPRLVTCGIWRSVGIRAWDVGRIEGVRIRQVVEGQERRIRMNVDIHSTDRPEGELAVLLNGRQVGGTRLTGDPGWRTHEVYFTLPDTGLWWPNGQGEQRLQKCRVEWRQGGRTVSTWEGAVGLRTIALEQRPDSSGIPFTFVVNQRPVFAMGANVVPPDQFLPRAGDSAWVRLVHDARDANMNMLRVWGGGVYPPDAFFSACDSAGIMVWQDFMFANAMVPDDDAFVDNVRDEVTDNLKRIQHHACLALWCGNNEVEVAWRNWGWQRSWSIDAADSTRMSNAYFDLFRTVIADQVQVLDHEHAYITTSPGSNWGNAQGLREHDLHYWGVWHTDSTFASFRGNTGRFVSEYGFQSYPDSATWAAYVSPRSLRSGSREVSMRQFSYRTDRPIQMAIRRELGQEPRSFGAFCDASQEVQAIAYREAIMAHLDARPRCMGSLLWQLNDVWPGPSWSLVSYGGRRKSAFDAVRSAFATANQGP